jgi:DNA-binding IclR family transcriptional regulator
MRLPLACSLADAAGPLHGIVALACPVLTWLARRTGTVIHLGALEDDMVKYLYKTGLQYDEFFTREDMQLEAYLSGVGQTLLANLPPAELELYLADGPFVAVAPNTIIDPEAIRNLVATVPYTIAKWLTEQGTQIETFVLPFKSPEFVVSLRDVPR